MFEFYSVLYISNFKYKMMLFRGNLFQKCAVIQIEIVSDKAESLHSYFSVHSQKHKAKYIFVHLYPTTETKGLSHKSLFANNEIHLILSL